MIRKFLFSITLTIIISFVFGQEVDYNAMPVADYKKPQEYIVKEVEVSGVKYLDKNILVRLSGLSIGQKVTIPGEDITKAIQKLWDQGLFSDVKISVMEYAGDSITLELFLLERHRLSELEINGLKKGKEKDIREKLELKRGMQVTQNLINSTERAIKDFLYDKKYLNSKVEIVQVDDTAVGLNNVKLRIYIDKGEKVKIKDINFYGNEVFEDGKLRRVMKETKKKNLNFFKPSKFIEDLYEEDKEKLITKYNTKGYRDAEIVADSVYQVSSKRISIDIEISEGKQYFFRSIDWVGNTKYDSDLLSAILKIKKGDAFDTEMLNERLNGEDGVGTIYLDNGYLFFNVSPVIQTIDNDSIDVQLRIFEGDRVRLNHVAINGNTKTNEHVIRRELRTKPGELFSRSDIMRSQRDLAQLGYFDPEQFGIEPVNINQAEGLVDLNYTLVEKSTDQLEVSGGWGRNMFVGTLGLRFSNFSARNMFDKKAWRPVPSGDGQTLSLRASTNGKYYSSYNISFVEPWLGGKKPNSFSISAYYSLQNRTDQFLRLSGENMKIFGASVGLGQRLKWPDDYFTLMNSINYQLFVLNDWRGNFLFSNGKSNNISWSTTFGRSSIDAPIYPRSGSSFSLTLQLTPPFSLFKKDNFWVMSSNEIFQFQQNLKRSYFEDWAKFTEDQKNDIIFYETRDKIESNKYKWIEYHKWKYKGSWYLRIWKDLVLASNSEFGYLGYYNKDIGHAPFGKFELGGDGLSGYSYYSSETIGLRGYENRSLTPQVRYGDSYRDDGNVYEKINFELRYPVSLKPQATIYVLGFVEAGNAWRSIDVFNPFQLKRSAGIGLRAFLPMFGLLGVDWGYGFDEVLGPSGDNLGGSQFHFVIGQQF